MASYVFDRILAKGVRSGQIPSRTISARNWFRKTAENTRVAPQTLLNGAQSTRLERSPELGQMSMFFYDPKWKKELPYYDRFPLIFPFRVKGNAFWGINMHYLPLPLRAKLMDALYSLSTDKRYDSNTRLRLTYSILNGASKFRGFAPCVKQYLFNHVRSPFINISAAEWDIALFLPVERFVGADKEQVWKDSRDAIYN